MSTTWTELQKKYSWMIQTDELCEFISRFSSTEEVKNFWECQMHSYIRNKIQNEENDEFFREKVTSSVEENIPYAKEATNVWIKCKYVYYFYG